MKFLCVCEAGTVRSGALAYSLRYNFSQKRVFQASGAKSDQEDLDLLAAWADYIIVLDQKFKDRFEKFSKKVRVFDVGPDVWKNPLHSELQRIVSEKAQEWANNKWLF